MADDDEGPRRGRPIGADSPTRRFNRGFASAARERCPPELFLEYYLARMEGKDAVLVRDERCTSTGGWRVEHRQGGPVPSGAERDRIMQHLQHAAYGLPAQQLVLDASIRQQSAVALVGVDARTLASADVRGRAEMLAAIERALGSGGSPAEPEGVPDSDVVDVEWTEGGDDPAEGGDDPAEGGDDPAQKRWSTQPNSRRTRPR